LNLPRFKVFIGRIEYGRQMIIKNAKIDKITRDLKMRMSITLLEKRGFWEALIDEHLERYRSLLQFLA